MAEPRLKSEIETPDGCDVYKYTQVYELTDVDLVVMTKLLETMAEFSISPTKVERILRGYMRNLENSKARRIRLKEEKIRNGIVDPPVKRGRPVGSISNKKVKSQPRPQPQPPFTTDGGDIIYAPHVKQKVGRPLTPPPE